MKVGVLTIKIGANPNYNEGEIIQTMMSMIPKEVNNYKNIKVEASVIEVESWDEIVPPIKK